MSILRICVVDPTPANPRDDVVVFQVPEHSRAQEILTQALEALGLQWVEIEPVRKAGRKRKSMKTEGEGNEVHHEV